MTTKGIDALALCAAPAAMAAEEHEEPGEESAEVTRAINSFMAPADATAWTELGPYAYFPDNRDYLSQPFSNSGSGLGFNTGRITGIAVAPTARSSPAGRAAASGGRATPHTRSGRRCSTSSTRWRSARSRSSRTRPARATRSTPAPGSRPSTSTPTRASACSPPRTRATAGTASAAPSCRARASSRSSRRPTPRRCSRPPARACTASAAAPTPPGSAWSATRTPATSPTPRCST